MEHGHTPPDEPPVPGDGARSELLALVRCLRGHVEELEASGVWGWRAAPRRATSAPALESAGAPGAVRPASPSGASRAAADAPASGEPATAASAAPGRREVAARGESGAAAAAPAPATGASPAPVHLPQASVERLRQIAEEASACTRCSLHQGRRQIVVSRGTGSSGVAFVGEAPGEEEDRQGFPFVGPAGQLLDRMIAAMQLERDAVYVCNIVKCRPPGNRKPEPEEMERCMPFLAEQLAIIQPRVIVALGATAVQGLLGTTGGITRLRGQWKLWRGKIPVMPTFHPAYLLRTPQAKRDVWKDLQEVLRHLKANPAPPA